MSCVLTPENVIQRSDPVPKYFFETFSALNYNSILPNSPAHQSLFAVVGHVLGSSEQIKKAGVAARGSLSQLSHAHTAEATDVRLFPAAEFLVSGMAFTV